MIGKRQQSHKTKTRKVSMTGIMGFFNVFFHSFFIHVFDDTCHNASQPHNIPLATHCLLTYLGPTQHLRYNLKKINYNKNIEDANAFVTP